jgi:ketosteroid isomerase-like protein
MNNKEILTTANAALHTNNHEGFLEFCTEDTTWNFIGDIILRGKQSVRDWMAATYIEPPVNIVETLIAEGNFVVATGTIAVKDKTGKTINSKYCDVWRFENGKLAEVNAYVVEL